MVDGVSGEEDIRRSFQRAHSVNLTLAFVRKPWSGLSDPGYHTEDCEARKFTMSKVEIRVAVIGYDAVGKTTVINALLHAEYGEIWMRRATPVVNTFRLVKKTSHDDRPVIPVDLPCLSTRKESMAGKDVVTEKTYDIQLEEPILELHHDTKVVIVDIPGINGDGAETKYMDYVNFTWPTFDIVVAVMDGRQGPEEHMDLLKLVKKNLNSIKKSLSSSSTTRSTMPKTKYSSLFSRNTERLWKICFKFQIETRLSVTFAAKSLLSRSKPISSHRFSH